jgi:hypothetical protein
MSSVFLSHNSNDKAWVRELAKRLTQDGVVVWLDEAELNIGDSLIDKISAAIDEMKFVAAVISPQSVQSAWVQKELSLAMSKEINGRRVTVLPLLIEQCELPAALRDKLYADFTKPSNFNSEYKKLLRAIGVQRTGDEAVVISSANPPKVEEVMHEQPQQLRIVGIAKEKTRQDPRHSGLQDYFLRLSEWPPPGWEGHFLEARMFPRHSMWRKAWIEGDCIVINCALYELGRYHVADLKQDVATANANLARADAEAAQRHQQELERIEADLKARDSALDLLKFD